MILDPARALEQDEENSLKTSEWTSGRERKRQHLREAQIQDLEKEVTCQSKETLAAW